LFISLNPFGSAQILEIDGRAEENGAAEQKRTLQISHQLRMDRRHPVFFLRSSSCIIIPGPSAAMLDATDETNTMMVHTGLSKPTSTADPPQLDKKQEIICARLTRSMPSPPMNASFLNGDVDHPVITGKPRMAGLCVKPTHLR
jgi:hypothetical protein